MTIPNTDKPEKVKQENFKSNEWAFCFFELYQIIDVDKSGNITKIKDYKNELESDSFNAVTFKLTHNGKYISNLILNTYTDLIRQKLYVEKYKQIDDKKVYDDLTKIWIYLMNLNNTEESEKVNAISINLVNDFFKLSLKEAESKNSIILGNDIIASPDYTTQQNNKIVY